jgi:NAD(P)-dependent dehydrogenase (short-subunit alcohol dehydrogenase family)
VKLKDKIALITGGSGGIGCAIGRRYAEEGATVALDAAAAERAPPSFSLPTTPTTSSRRPSTLMAATG